MLQHHHVEAHIAEGTMSAVDLASPLGRSNCSEGKTVRIKHVYLYFVRNCFYIYKPPGKSSTAHRPHDGHSWKAGSVHGTKEVAQRAVKGKKQTLAVKL